MRDRADSRIQPSAPKRRGRRPGAGAPRGNLNALKSGRYSKNVKALRIALQAVPATTDVIRRFDAPADAKRDMLARALHFIAELIVADPAVFGAMQNSALGQSRIASGIEGVEALKQSLVIAGIDPIQLRELAKTGDNDQTIKGSV